MSAKADCKAVQTKVQRADVCELDCNANSPMKIPCISKMNQPPL